MHWLVSGILKTIALLGVLILVLGILAVVFGKWS
jgi:hypothetical protein